MKRNFLLILVWIPGLLAAAETPRLRFTVKNVTLAGSKGSRASGYRADVRFATRLLPERREKFVNAVPVPTTPGSASPIIYQDERVIPAGPDWKSCPVLRGNGWACEVPRQGEVVHFAIDLTVTVPNRLIGSSDYRIGFGSTARAEDLLRKGMLEVWVTGGDFTSTRIELAVSAR